MKRIATLLVAYCLAYFHDAHAKINILQKSHVDTERRLVFARNSYIDERLAYALCDKNLPASEVKCTIIREKQPYGTDDYSCNVTIKREYGDAKYEPSIRLYQFGDRYVTLNSWDGGSKTFLTFTTVQLDTCKFVETKFNASIADHNYSMTFVGRNNSFDVLHYCGGDGGKWCKVTIDAEGRLTREKEPSIGPFYGLNLAKQSVISLDQISPAGGYFYIKAGYYYIEAGHPQDTDTLVKSDGTEISLTKRPRSITAHMAMTIKNNLIGVCRQTDTEYDCRQYDFDGNMKLQTAIVRDYNDKMGLVDIYNLPNGGFYILSRVCGKLDDFLDECEDVIKRLVVERIDATGSKSQPLTFQISPDYFDYGLTTVFYENKNKETCVSLAAFKGTRGSIKKGRAQLYSTANCFTDADFMQ